MLVLRFVMKAAGVIPRCRRRGKWQKTALRPKLFLQKLQVLHSTTTAEVQQDHRQDLLGVPVPFALSDSYGSVDDFKKMKSVPKFDDREKTGKGGNVLHLVRRLDLDFRESVWHNYRCTSLQ